MSRKIKAGIDGVYGWHAHDGYLGYNDWRKIRVGHTLKVKGPIRICHRGLHVGTLSYVLRNYGSHRFLSYVEAGGDVHKDFLSETEKFAARTRKVLWQIDLLRDATCSELDFLLSFGATPQERLETVLKIRRRKLRLQAARRRRLALRRTGTGSPRPGGSRSASARSKKTSARPAPRGKASRARPAK